jgi:peptidoglycan/xylan/chitin deacetylase (PgdA/CDA1 family)
MLPVYCYHHVVPLHIYKTVPIKDKYLYVTTIKFEEQMKILKNKNITTLSTNEFISCIKNEKSYNNCAMITFDDGNENQYTYAYPILKKYNMKAIFFLITSRINNKVYLKEKHLCEMNDLIDYQCHTHILHNMNKIMNTSSIDKYNDLITCISILKKYNRLDINDYLFCFPYGNTGKYFKSIFKTNLFKGYFAGGNIIYDPKKHNIFNIPRITIS